MVKAQLIFTLATVAVANAFSPNSSPQTVSFLLFSEEKRRCISFYGFLTFYIPENCSGYGD